MPTNIKATREGLIGRPTSSGYIIDKVVPYVALPSVRALHHFIYILNPLNGKKVNAIVLDVGPHFTNDEDYVFGYDRPRAEGISVMNGAGIDLGEYVWKQLGMLDNTKVEWGFISTPIAQKDHEAGKEIKNAT